MGATKHKKPPENKDEIHSLDLKLDSIAQASFHGKCDRYDSRIRIGSEVRKLSLYFMNDNLVRIDIKTVV